mgnify:CR=1 FL=1
MHETLTDIPLVGRHLEVAPEFLFERGERTVGQLRQLLDGYVHSHSCENCSHRMHVSMPAWGSIRNFFTNANNYLRDEDFHHDRVIINIFY